jgi:hypothetical protein
MLTRLAAQVTPASRPRPTRLRLPFDADRGTAAAMADDAGEPPAQERPPFSPPGGFDSWPVLRRRLVLGLGFLVPAGVLVASVVYIVKHAAPEGAPALSPSAGQPLPNLEASASATTATTGSAPPLEPTDGVEQIFDEDGSDEQPSPKPRTAAPKHFATVEQAAAGSCSTESVDGLSRQIIEQARCIEPNAFVPLPKRPNLVVNDHVFPYLESGAREHLLRALDAHTSATMTINSALRTVAQQYLVWRWSATKSCGVPLATPPGESNHEIGVALDIAEAAKWRPALEAQDFRWLGASDRVHFDYKGGSGPPSRSATDVLAFQKLWNKNNRADAIPENGQYGPATEQRLKKAPASGFALGPSCRNAGGKH